MLQNNIPRHRMGNSTTCETKVRRY